MRKTISAILSLLMIISVLFSFGASADAAQAKTVSGKFNYSYASEVLSLVNEERADYGLKPLVMTQSLTDGAMIRAAETSVSFSHTRPNGEQCFTAFEWKYYAGENIAAGQGSPKAVVNAWMNSSGHRANILSSNFATIGIGCFEYNGRLYWSQAFSGGSGSSVSPSGSRGVTVEVSLVQGVGSKVIFDDETTTLPQTTQPTTKAPEITTRPATTRQTTQQTTAPSLPETTTGQTTQRQTEPSTAQSTTAKSETATEKAEQTTCDECTTYPSRQQDKSSNSVLKKIFGSIYNVYRRLFGRA